MTSVIIYNSRWLRPVRTLACMMECITSSVCTRTVQAMDYTFNMKGPLGKVVSPIGNALLDHALYGFQRCSVNGKVGHVVKGRDRSRIFEMMWGTNKGAVNKEIY